MSISLTYRLDANTVSPAIARAHTAHLIDARTLPSGRGAAALLVVSELVTNAVIHGSEPIDLALEINADVLRIEVGDGDPAVDDVAMRNRSSDDTHAPDGRGLRIVDALSDSWGVSDRPSGKTVWATVRIGPVQP